MWKWFHLSFWFVNVDTRKLEITYVTQSIFLLDNAVLDPKKTNLCET